MKYAFIKRHHETFTETRMCHMMGVSQSAYYDWLKRPESARSLDDRRLSEKVKTIHKQSREIYGARRIIPCRFSWRRIEVFFVSRICRIVLRYAGIKRGVHSWKISTSLPPEIFETDQAIS